MKLNGLFSGQWAYGLYPKLISLVVKETTSKRVVFLCYDTRIMEEEVEMSPRAVFIFAIVYLALWIGIFIGLSYLARYIYSVLLELGGTTWLRTLAVVGIAIIGFVLWSFRESYRTQYGLIEIAFGLVSAWIGLFKIETAGYTEAVAVVGAVYLVGQGIDNFNIGRAKLLRGGNRRLTFKN